MYSKKQISMIVILQLLHLGVSSIVQEAKALRLEAGVREFFSSPGRNSYGGDAAAKMKMKLGSIGFDRISLQTRIGYSSDAGGVFYLPPLRSSKDDLEIMISRIFHADADPVLKPLVYSDPGLGTPIALTSGIGGTDREFSGYSSTLESYASILPTRSIEEFVIGAGLTDLFRRQHHGRWGLLLEWLQSRASPSTGFSLEVSSEEALRVLEDAEKSDPTGFMSAWSGIKKVRISLDTSLWMDSRTLTPDASSLQQMIRDGIGRIQRILPGRSIMIANGFIPACSGFLTSHGEVVCPKGAKALYGPQRAALKTFLETVSTMEPGPDTVELMTSTTLDEPTVGEGDLRFLLPNPGVEQELRDFLKLNVHQSESFSSPRKSAFRFFEDAPGKRHACIYFDEVDSRDSIGAVHARMIDNLVGAFPKWAKERRTLQGYLPGDLKDCDVVFYLASNFNSPVPDGFLVELEDFLEAKTVVWFNYKFDRFSDHYKQSSSRHGLPPLAFQVPRFIQADAPPTPANPDPGFFRYFHYKGEVFEKPARFDPLNHVFAASPELGAIHLEVPDRVDVLSHSEHSKTRELTPYIVRQELGSTSELYYVADLPFSFNHYEDRSLIFCDVMYDILREPAPSRPPLALVRLEDINPSIDSRNLIGVVDYLSDRNIPFSMALIPFYSNLFQDPMRGRVSPVYLPIDRVPGFKGVLDYAKARGANFVMHGVAHQAGDLISGFSGDTGSDYEFWSWPEDRPHPRDRAAWVISRIESAEAVLDRLKLKPIAWEVPHYAGSALDFVLFGRMFEWNYHRGLYFKSEIVRPTPLGSKEWFFHCSDSGCRKDRIRKASELEVQADYSSLGSQIFPYPIFEDSYGQSIIPESLGMVDFPFYRSDTWRPVSTPEDLLRRARKLRVIRGAMASFFWHPILLDQNSVYYREVPGSFEARGGLKTLDALIRGLKSLGYEFGSIGDCRWFPRRDCAPSEPQTSNPRDSSSVSSVWGSVR